MYKPLPHGITVNKSEIDGLGLFATEKIENGKVLGVSHIKESKAEDGYWRTPLGGFINHSDNPNCIKEENRFTGNLFLKTEKVIKEGEELTVKYTLYEVKKLLPLEDHWIPGLTERPTPSEEMQDKLEPIDDHVNRVLKGSG